MNTTCQYDKIDRKINVIDLNILFPAQLQIPLLTLFVNLWTLRVEMDYVGNFANGDS